MLDPTGITTPGGRKFLLERGGAAGTEIADNYAKILADIGVAKYVPDVAKANTANGYPFVEASNRGQPRGNALPLLMDMKRKPKFLHDGSVASLAALLDPARTAVAPHPFFIVDPTERANVVQFLNSLDDQPLD